MYRVPADTCFCPKCAPYLVAVLNLAVCMCFGALLLYGIIKVSKNATCVLVYLIILCSSAIAQTALHGFYIALFSPSTGNMVVSGGSVVLAWVATYCVYLIYRYLKTKETEAITKKTKIINCKNYIFTIT